MAKNKLIITMGGKGGVGKSVILTALADYLVTKGVDFEAYDADTENAQISSAFTAAYPQAERVNLKSSQDLDAILEKAAECPITIMDLPASATQDFLPWFEAVAEPMVLEELNLEIIGIGVITPAPGDFASVGKWAANLQDRVKYWITLNHKELRPTSVPLKEVFKEYLDTQTGKQFREIFSPVEIELPALPEVALKAWAQVGGLPTDATKNPKIPVINRSRIHRWIKQIHAQFDAALNQEEVTE